MSSNSKNIVPPSSGTSIFQGLFSSFGLVMILILIVFVALVIYYKTVGYYMEFGWNRIWKLITGGTSVDVEFGDGTLDANIKPMDAPPTNNMPPPDSRPSGMPGATEGSNPLISALSSLTKPAKEVFNVSRNIYTFHDASAVCSALDSELATYDQVREAYHNGADWCNYGWIKGQMAVYPTQKDTWTKLQKGAPEYRDACGRPGVNGGVFDNPDLRFGVNCYGPRPPKSATDELLESQVALPPSADEIEYNKKVQKFREQLSTISVLPFNRGQWAD